MEATSKRYATFDAHASFPHHSLSLPLCQVFVMWMSFISHHLCENWLLGFEYARVVISDYHISSFMRNFNKSEHVYSCVLCDISGDLLIRVSIHTMQLSIAIVKSKLHFNFISIPFGKSSF
jgi:hypothetical protein